MKNQDIREVYLSDLRGKRKRASANRVADKWIEKAIQKPGRLHKHFGIPEDEDIPVSEIKGEITKLKKKEDRSAEETSLLRALNLALTLKGMNKGARLDSVSLGEMMISAASQARLFHKLDMKRFVGVYEEVGMNLVRLGDTDDFDDRQYLISEIDSGLKFLRGHDIKAMSAALEGMTAAYGLVAGRFR